MIFGSFFRFLPQFTTVHFILMLSTLGSLGANEACATDIDYVPSRLDAPAVGRSPITATKWWILDYKAPLLIFMQQGSPGVPHDESGRWIIGGSVATDPKQASIDLNQLSWTSIDKDWNAAQFTVTVANAAALSLQMAIVAPKGAGLLAYGSVDGSAEQLSIDAIVGQDGFQTPPTSGATVLVELRLRNTVKLSEVTLKIPRLFDYWLDPQTALSDPPKTSPKVLTSQDRQLGLLPNYHAHTAAAPRRDLVQIYNSTETVPGNLGWANYAFNVLSFSHPDRFDARPLGCHMDIACRDYLWGTPYNGVVKITFTHIATSGMPVTASCSATLINSIWPSDLPGSSPDIDRLFLVTARHCIETPEQARTVNVYWFYQVPSERMACLTRSADLPFGGARGLPETYTRLASGGFSPATHPVAPLHSRDLATGLWRSSGAQLLWAAPRSSDYSSDLSLLRLHDVPEHVDFAGFYGGEFALPQNRDNVISVHHPYGDVKKTARGTIVEETPGDDYGDGLIGPDYSVDFEQGGIESGSSGGGLFARVDAAGDHRTDPVLVGALTGGGSFPYSAKCRWDASNGRWEYANTRYAQFKAVFPNVRRWLAPTAEEEPLVRAELSMPF